jgi:hypothetical protein
MTLEIEFEAEGKEGKNADPSTTAPDDTGNWLRLARTIFPNDPGALHILPGLVGFCELLSLRDGLEAKRSISAIASPEVYPASPRPKCAPPDDS